MSYNNFLLPHETMIPVSELNRVTRVFSTRILLHVMNKNFGVKKFGEMQDAAFHAACQALALVLVGTFLDPIVKTWSPGVRTFVFLCFLLHIVYRIATAKRTEVTSS